MSWESLAGGSRPESARVWMLGSPAAGHVDLAHPAGLADLTARARCPSPSVVASGPVTNCETPSKCGRASIRQDGRAPSHRRLHCVALRTWGAAWPPSRIKTCSGSRRRQTGHAGPPSNLRMGKCGGTERLMGKRTLSQSVVTSPVVPAIVAGASCVDSNPLPIAVHATSSRPRRRRQLHDMPGLCDSAKMP